MARSIQKLVFAWQLALPIAAVCAGVAAASESLSAAEPPQSAEVNPQVETNVGVEGVYFLRHASAGITPRPVDERSPIVLRVASVQRDGQSYLYEIRYIGTLPGRHDLRDYLLRADGEPLAEGPPLMVEVKATLPGDHDGSLDALDFAARPAAWPYRTLALGGIALWLFVTTVLVMRRWLQQQPRLAVAQPGPPSLADQLRPLVEQAIAGRLTTAQQARLEMLLLGHWRKTLQLNDDAPHESLRKLRSDPKAGQLLRSLEAWLHQPPGTQTIDVAAVLAPYRDAAPVTMEPQREASPT